MSVMYSRTVDLYCICFEFVCVFFFFKQKTAYEMRISDWSSDVCSSDLIEQSNAHPYVMKILLGEIANAGSFSKPEKLIVRKEEILDALFERTYANLSPIASRVFLPISGWRSLVPQLAVEAVDRKLAVEGQRG